MNFVMLRILSVLFVSIMLVGCGVTSREFASPNRDSTTLLVPTPMQNTETVGPQATTSMKLLQRVPVYPNAKEIQTDMELPPAWSTLSFVVADDYKDVFTYYKQVLLKQGWTLVYEHTYYPGIIFLWQSKSGTADWNADLSVSTEPVSDTTERIKILFRVWPDPKDVPLYPDASGVTVGYEQDQDGLLWQVTTYSSKVSPDEVENYYRSILPTTGWNTSSVSGSITSSRGLVFTYFGGPRAGLNLPGGSVYIKAEIQTEGQTRIELRAVGDNIGTPDVQQHR